MYIYEGRTKMKKILILTLAALFIVSGCGKVPKLENGQEAVVTMTGGDISVDSLYNDLKDKYALNILINKIDKQILEELYPESDDEKDYIKIEYRDGGNHLCQHRYHGTCDHLDR